MILGIYAILGVFLVIASRNPLAHRCLNWFTVWSSIAHGGIMGSVSGQFAEHGRHVSGDVLALFVVAIGLVVLTPGGATFKSSLMFVPRSLKA
jgi:hypothetical protein